LNLNPKSIPVNMNMDDSMFKLLILLCSIFAILVGFFAMKLEPYFPKHIKERMQKEKDDELKQ